MEDLSFSSKYYRFVFKEGIFFLTYINGPITIDIAKEVVNKRLELTEGISVLMLIDDESLKGIDRDARDFLSSNEGVRGVKAAALLTSNYFSQHLANFFLKISVNKPKIPAKVYANREEAIKWLKQFQ